jgi:hypothetical protein
MLPISCFGISCIMSLDGHPSAFLEAAQYYNYIIIYAV